MFYQPFPERCSPDMLDYNLHSPTDMLSLIIGGYLKSALYELYLIICMQNTECRYTVTIEKCTKHTFDPGGPGIPRGPSNPWAPFGPSSP